MGDCETRPVEDLLGDESFFTRITFRIAISGSLRQIDDRGDACFPRGLREIDGRVDKPGLDWVDQIRHINAFYGLADCIDIVEVADYDFGAQLFQRHRSIVLAVHHGADSKAKCDRFFNGRTTGVSGCTRDQYFAVHFSVPILGGTLFAQPRGRAKFAALWSIYSFSNRRIKGEEARR